MSKASEVIQNPINKILEITDKTKRTEAIGDLELLNAELDKVRQATRGLLGIESQTLNAFKAQEDKLSREILMVETGLRYKDFPEFPMKAFSWRDKDGYPRVVPFSLTSPRFTIGYVCERFWSGSSYRMNNFPELPREVRKMYKDVSILMKEKAKERKKSVKIEALFTGVIPEDVRTQIHETKPLFKNVYVVAEVQKWKLAESAPIRRVDPLLVGWDGYRMWLLASFDTTSTEKYLEKLALKPS